MDGSYDGIKLEDLSIREISISEEIADHIARRDERHPNAPGVPLIAVMEAAADPFRIISRWPRSRTGEALALLGFSATAGRLVLCLIVPDDHPPSNGTWHLATAWFAGRRESRPYYEQQEGEIDA